jgi:DNA-binding beta-propeller fold protein YncE
VNTAGTYLYVITSSGSGANTAVLTEYSLTSGMINQAAPVTQTLALASYTGDTIIPTGITVLANTSTVTGNAVYVTAYDQSAYNPGGPTSSNNLHPGWVFGFTVGSGGAFTATTGSPYQAGVKPSALTADPTDRFLYVTDYASNKLIGYTIHDGSTLSLLPVNITSTGNEPSAIVVDPRGMFIYVTNALDNTVSAYEITLATGTPTAVVNVTGSPINSTDTQPVAIIVDQALGRFVYTANYLNTSISGFLLNPTSGAIVATQATPYPTSSGLPTALVSVPHGNHATQSVNP